MMGAPALGSGLYAVSPQNQFLHIFWLQRRNSNSSKPIVVDLELSSILCDLHTRFIDCII